jgi:hypothetical protein
MVEPLFFLKKLPVKFKKLKIAAVGKAFALSVNTNNNINSRNQ